MKRLVFTIFIPFFCLLSVFAQFSDLKTIVGFTPKPNSLKLADIDNDGDLDLIYLCKTPGNDDFVAWQENIDGNGSYGEQRKLVEVNSINSLKDITMSDIDNDGDLDIIVGQQQWLTVYINSNGEGLYTLYSDKLTINMMDNYIAVSDLDNDGDYDIITAGRSSGTPPFSFIVSWFENIDGTGNLGDQQIIYSYEDYSTKVNVYSLDIDNDGDNDVVTLSGGNDDYTGKLMWYENSEGSGQFNTTHTICDTLNNPSYMVVGDFENDNDIDVFVALQGNNTIVWFENNDGQGNFSSQTQLVNLGYKPVTICLNDFDGDNYSDLMVGADSYISPGLRWYKNINGTGVLGSEVIFGSLQAQRISLVSGDIDNDGDNDILCGINNNLVTYKNMDGFGNFGGEIAINPYLDYPTMLRTGDIDSDGYLDIITNSGRNDTVFWLRNSNSFEFELRPLPFVHGNALSVGCADLDGDSYIDIILSYSDTLAWMRNYDGQGNFEEPNLICTYGAINLNMTDVDNDDDIDIIFSSSDKIYYAENSNGLGSFNEIHIIYEGDSSVYGDSPRDIICCDIDNDGDTDFLALYNYYPPNFISLFINDGLGDFSRTNIIVDNIQEMFVCDIDSDGDKDILCAIYSTQDELIILTNEIVNDSATFNNLITIDNSNSQDEIVAMDVDFDGDMDIIRGVNDGMSWYENLNGSYSFSTPHQISDKNYMLSDLLLVDLDNDGDKDIVSSELIYGRIAVFENYTFGAPYLITGTVFYDENSNGVFDDNEQALPNIMIQAEPAETMSFSNNIGVFRLYVGEGDYSVTHEPLQSWNLTTDSVEYNVAISQTTTYSDSLLFLFSALL